ncbi:MAG: partition protein [Thiopseudomonas sp.]|nr:partition protein [Thiopseudomonas sp.]MCK9466489.1 partition protein [Thiopseudomonas sp.]
MIMNIGSMSLITPVGVRALIAAGSVEDASIQAISTEGLAVVIKTKKETFVLGRMRGGIRVFVSVDGAASVLIQFGIKGFYVNAEGWLPRTLQKQSLAGNAD